MFAEATPEVSSSFTKVKKWASVAGYAIDKTRILVIAQDFNSTGLSTSDVQVRGVALCSETNIRQKQREMRLIFHLGTLQLKGLNNNFKFI